MKLPVEWLRTKAAVAAAEQRQKDPASPTRILLVNGSTRSQHTCPGEISKTLRLVQHARQVIESLPRPRGGRARRRRRSPTSRSRSSIPCKACVSTAQPLCHWPCSCYPNHALGQTNDWMAELYPRWVAAHGVFIATAR